MSDVLAQDSIRTITFPPEIKHLPSVIGPNLWQHWQMEDLYSLGQGEAFCGYGSAGCVIAYRSDAQLSDEVYLNINGQKDLSVGVRCVDISGKFDMRLNPLFGSVRFPDMVKELDRTIGSILDRKDDYPVLRSVERVELSENHWAYVFLGDNDTFMLVRFTKGSKILGKEVILKCKSGSILRVRLNQMNNRTINSSVELLFDQCAARIEENARHFCDIAMSSPN